MNEQDRELLQKMCDVRMASVNLIEDLNQTIKEFDPLDIPAKFSVEPRDLRRYEPYVNLTESDMRRILGNEDEENMWDESG
ncbi:hypothetical protein LCGC14_2920680 [marine sediment metagenome]|uniref:Uncharacterized protein n=1 Tax=marine sediment metagenome TaxID=412755 RepID=A0A0F8XNY4_9ZZZZ